VEAMAVKPLGDRVLVEKEEVQKTPGGIIIPDTAKEKPQKGKVIAVGEGRKDDNGKRIPMDVAVGDVIIFSKYGGSEIEIEGEEYLILHENDIIAKIV
jgi:chaperonin GroES